ncbi:MAG: hypothetical protein DSZ05_08005 [Sulfurospirillum sp.]|nr:MAG: hypothetical protein DSZ05_08005 [Sulfurospirillum sp.]
MGLLNVIKKHLTMQYVGVIVHETSCVVKIKKVKNAQTIHEEEKQFTIPSKEKLSKEVIVFLQSLQEEVEQTYIALFLNSHGQGVVPSCAKFAYEKFHIEYDHVKVICIDRKYSIYASNIDIRWAEKIFSETGLDFIFSPFLMLDNLRKHESRREGIVLHMLTSHNSITIMIFDKETLLYGTFINIAKEEDLLNTDFTEEIIDEDDTFDEIDLDMELEESDEIAEILENATIDTEVKSSAQDENDTIKLKLFGQDLRLVKYFDASLREFYENDLYKSDFVTYVKIYDTTSLNEDIVHYLKEQLLVDISIRKINIEDELIALIEQETGRA